MKNDDVQHEGPISFRGEEVPLSVVFDALQVQGEPRGQDFVRRVCLWLHERSHHLEFEVVEALRLQDVVVTFKMKEKVSLIITGYPPEGLPGAVTLSIAEGEFPHVAVRVHESPSSNRLELCTMDYSFAGRRVAVMDASKGERKGEVVVVSTIGEKQNCRVRLDNGDLVNASYEQLQWSGETAP